jgi:hypothetical protein
LAKVLFACAPIKNKLKKISSSEPKPTTQKQRAPDDAGALRVSLLLLLLASLRRNLSGLGRRVHGRLVGAHVTEQDGAVRQILFHQAGAGGRDRASNRVSNRVSRVEVAAPVEVHMTVAVAVEVVAMPVPAVPVVVMMVVVTMPVMAVVVVVTMVAVGTVVTMVAVGTVVTAAVLAVAAVTTAVMAVAAALTAAVATRISSRGDESCQADDERRGEGEECSTFEHFRGTFGFETFWLDVNHPKHSSG